MATDKNNAQTKRSDSGNKTSGKVADKTQSSASENASASGGEQTFKKKNLLTPAQLANLKTGPRVNILVGHKGDAFIGIEGAYINLLKHYCGLAKKQLINGNASILFIEGVSKSMAQWLYGYMLAGEKDAALDTKIVDLSISEAVDLYGYAAQLEYQSLMDRLHGFLRFRFHNTLPNAQSIQKIASVIPSLMNLVVKLIAEFMVQPLTVDYEQYMKYAEEDAAFGSALDEAFRKVLEHRASISAKYYNSGHPNRYVRESKAIYEKVDAQKTMVCYNCKEQGHIARHCTNEPAPAPIAPGITYPAAVNGEIKPKESRHPGPICYNCNKRGHIARDCTENVPATNGHPTALTNGLPSKEKTNRPGPICYNCNERGHIARNCTVAVPANDAADQGTKIPNPDAGRGRNKHRRRAQGDRYVDWTKGITVGGY